jgi:hypothetical protein
MELNTAQNVAVKCTREDTLKAVHKYDIVSTVSLVAYFVEKISNNGYEYIVT